MKEQGNEIGNEFCSVKIIRISIFARKKLTQDIQNRAFLAYAIKNNKKGGCSILKKWVNKFRYVM